MLLPSVMLSALITLAHCVAVRRGHPRHQQSPVAVMVLIMIMGVFIFPSFPSLTGLCRGWMEGHADDRHKLWRDDNFQRLGLYGIPEGLISLFAVGQREAV